MSRNNIIKDVIKCFIIITIIAYIIVGLFANTASAYFPESIQWLFLPEYAKDKMLFQTLIIELLPFWFSVGVLVAIVIGYKYRDLIKLW